MIFGSGWQETCSLLIGEYFMVSLVLLWDPFYFHTFLLPLVSSFDGPFLSEVRFADLGPLLPFFVLCPSHPYFLQLHPFADEPPLLPINLRVECLQPRVSQDYAILP
jgi:hypothetical protein